MPMNEYRKDDKYVCVECGGPRARTELAEAWHHQVQTLPAVRRYRRLPATPRKRIHVVTDRDGGAFQILSAKKPPSSEDA